MTEYINTKELFEFQNDLNMLHKLMHQAGYIIPTVIHNPTTTKRKTKSKSKKSLKTMEKEQKNLFDTFRDEMNMEDFDPDKILSMHNEMIKLDVNIMTKKLEPYVEIL